jgi:hypothetical protein
MMTEKNRDKLHLLGFVIGCIMAILAALNLLVNLIYYLVKNN